MTLSYGSVEAYMVIVGETKGTWPEQNIIESSKVVAWLYGPIHVGAQSEMLSTSKAFFFRDVFALDPEKAKQSKIKLVL